MIEMAPLKVVHTLFTGATAAAIAGGLGVRCVVAQAPIQD
jgi:hypothetical protein